MSKTPNLSAAYALKTADDSRRLYADWATTYDDTFAKEHAYISPQVVADAFIAAGGQGPVLDVGAGTGLCGEALKAQGLSPLHATDISPQMLDVARSKSIYAHLFVDDILVGLSADDGAYAGVVSSGTFTNGHVGPRAMKEVVRILAPGGLAVLSVNEKHYEAAEFAAELTNLEPDLAKITLSKARLYAEGATGAHANDLAVLVHLFART